MNDELGLLRRYLLGELDESEQEALERKLMTSDEHFEELSIAEDELVDDYWEGELSASHERKYRQRFLITPDRRVQHRFGALLRKRLAADPVLAGATPAEKPTPGFAPMWKLPFAAAVAALIVAVGVWFLVSTQRSPVRLEETAQRVEDSTAAFFLMTESLRSATSDPGPIITVPAGVTLVELQLDLPFDARGDYDVRLEDVRDGTILAEGTLSARPVEGQWVVVAAVPSDVLVPGDYRISVDGAQGAPIRIYEFRVGSQ